MPPAPVAEPEPARADEAIRRCAEHRRGRRRPPAHPGGPRLGSGGQPGYPVGPAHVPADHRRRSTADRAAAPRSAGCPAPGRLPPAAPRQTRRRAGPARGWCGRRPAPTARCSACAGGTGPRGSAGSLLLIDVSGSMKQHSPDLLRFGHAVLTSCERAEVFTFGTRLTHASAALRAADPDTAVRGARLGRPGCRRRHPDRVRVAGLPRQPPFPHDGPGRRGDRLLRRAGAGRLLGHDRRRSAAGETEPPAALVVAAGLRPGISPADPGDGGDHGPPRRAGRRVRPADRARPGGGRLLPRTGGSRRPAARRLAHDHSGV